MTTTTKRIDVISTRRMKIQVHVGRCVAIWHMGGVKIQDVKNQD